MSAAEKKPIPHHQQVGRNPLTGERRQWRAGEPPIYAKGNKLNPRRRVKTGIGARTVAEALYYWSAETVRKLRGAA